MQEIDRIWLKYDEGGLLDRLDSMIFAAPAVAGVVLLGAGDMLAWR